MVATAVAPLVHVPPPVALVNVVEEPEHIEVVPPIAKGKGLTDMMASVKQPVGSV
jgi:hypothetical protein